MTYKLRDSQDDLITRSSLGHTVVWKVRPVLSPAKGPHSWLRKRNSPSKPCLTCSGIWKNAPQSGSSYTRTRTSLFAEQSVCTTQRFQRQDGPPPGSRN